MVRSHRDFTDHRFGIPIYQYLSPAGCGGRPNDAVRAVQRALVDPAQAIVAGPDTDVIPWQSGTTDVI